MKLVENDNLNGATITIDDCHFINCRYEKCTVYYSGGDFELTGTTFIHCDITMLGPAKRTFTLLSAIRVNPTGGGAQPDRASIQ